MEKLLLRKLVTKKFYFKIYEMGLHKRSPALRFLKAFLFLNRFLLQLPIRSV